MFSITTCVGCGWKGRATTTPGVLSLQQPQQPQQPQQQQAMQPIMPRKIAMLPPIIRAFIPSDCELNQSRKENLNIFIVSRDICAVEFLILTLRYSGVSSEELSVCKAKCSTRFSYATGPYKSCTRLLKSWECSLLDL